MDRFFRGFTAGIIGGIVMNLWTLVALFILKWELIRFIDWSAIMIFGDLPRSHLEGLFSLLMQLLWVGMLGVILAFLFPKVTSQGYLAKGALFGVVFGFLFYAIPTLFQIPILKEHSFATVISNHTGGLLWGLTAAQTLRWLDKRLPAK